MPTLTIGAYEAKTRLPELLRAVAAGQSFTITNRDRAVAELVPVRRDDTDFGQAVQAMQDFIARRGAVSVETAELDALRREDQR